jgi:hypothetical protein
METIYYILKAIVYLYFGFGIGHNVSTLKDGAKVYLIEDGQSVHVTGLAFLLFVWLTTILWPLYYNRTFRKTFMISARWQ